MIPFLLSQVHKLMFVKIILKKLQWTRQARILTKKEQRETNFKNLPHNFFIIYELEGKRNKGRGNRFIPKEEQTQTSKRPEPTHRLVMCFTESWLFSPCLGFSNIEGDLSLVETLVSRCRSMRSRVGLQRELACATNSPSSHWGQPGRGLPSLMEQSCWNQDS